MKYTKDHEWVVYDAPEFTIGITEYAAEQLGDVTYVELPQEGDWLEAGDEAVVIESVKAASEILSPASGEVVEVNQELADNPALLNEDPQESGWIFRMVPEDPSDFGDLLDEDAYAMLTSQ
ncbi:MAG: glycine cleavage system protein GcvH [Rhodobacteraceae bacterium]|nr:glycine cleavage system protein GcvH [Paracoccaceae bacterium]